VEGTARQQASKKTPASKLPVRRKDDDEWLAIAVAADCMDSSCFKNSVKQRSPG
jgi:hypothetical protein